MYKCKVMNYGLVVVLAAAPVFAHAVTRQQGLEACADAMVKSLANNQGAPMGYRLNTDSHGGTKKLGRRETYHLDAFNPEGGKVVARMDCVINSRAEVTHLIPVALDAGEARARARATMND